MASPRKVPIFFPSSAKWRQWLARHHATAPLLWVGFHKRGTGRPSLTWPESVDKALCYGWIDGVRKRIDEERYMIRFTPRRAGSIWSVVNTKRAAELIAAGLMAPAGLRAFEGRDPKKTKQYSFEQERGQELSPALARQLGANRAAVKFLESQPPWYRRVTSWYVMSAKKEETRLRRLTVVIRHSALGERLPGMIGSESKG